MILAWAGAGWSGQWCLISGGWEDLCASCLLCLKAPKGKTSLVGRCLGLCALTACGPEFSPWLVGGLRSCTQIVQRGQ